MFCPLDFRKDSCADRSYVKSEKKSCMTLHELIEEDCCVRWLVFNCFHNGASTDMLPVKLGQPLPKEVEVAIFGKKVFCFVKLFMADKNYTVLQLYTKEALPASEAIEIHTDDPQSVFHMVEQPTKETTQIFSPTTKAILGEIADSVESKDETCTQPQHSKRT